MLKYFSVVGSVLAMVFLSTLSQSCKGQNEKLSIISTVDSTKTFTKVIGAVPPINLAHNPYNDTGLVSQYIRSIFQDSKGKYWFGPAGESVASYDGETLEYYSKADFFQGNEYKTKEEFISVHAIAEDKLGNIWFGTDHGAVRYNGTAFKSYTEKDGLGNTNIGRQCILVDSKGMVWVGTQAGVFQYNVNTEYLGQSAFKLFDLIPKTGIAGFLEDKEGNIYIATKGEGVFRYDGKSIEHISEKPGLGDHYAGSMVEDKNGNIWVTLKNGISRYDGKSFQTFTNEDGVGGTEIWGIYGEKSGTIWITARGSTTQFNPSDELSNPSSFTVFTEKDGLNCCVQSMYQDRKGRMWWGTGQGLYRFDGERFFQVKQTGPW